MPATEYPASEFGAERARVDTLVIAEDALHDTAREAVHAAHGTVMGCVGWHEARQRLERQTLLGVVLAEACGADDDTVVQILPLLDALARSGEARVVVTFNVEQLDLVFANLTAPGIELLCAPTALDRVAALCLAGPVTGATLHDMTRDAEAARLRRLNDEVARIAETLARLTRDGGERGGLAQSDSARGDSARGDSTVGERTLSYRAGPVSTDAPDVPARDIREAIRSRRLRDQFFGGGLFEDPAWDMLLDLFAAEIERAQVSVSSLCIAAAVAPTTALRWISRMTDAGLFERQPDPFDRRRAFMGLSERASAGMRDYVAAVRRAGLGIA